MSKGALTKVQVVVLLVIIIGSIIAYFVGVHYLYPQLPPEPPSPPPPPHQSRQPIDSDGDGIDNIVEGMYGLNRRNPDTDGDGIPDGVELDRLADSDGDGLINALDRDSDNDGLPDGVEDLNHNGVVDPGETNPIDPDSDNDGLLDGLEDGNLNGIFDEGETDPLNPDSDGDGLEDGLEPMWNIDTDGDGLINALDKDSDSDGLEDGVEVEINTNPLDSDTDDDGVIDGLEVVKGLNATNPDTDQDGLFDGEEAVDGAWWVEAEELAYLNEQIVNDTSANGNKTLYALRNGSIFSAKPFGTVPGGTYKLYLRAKYWSQFPFNPLLSNPEIRISIIGGGINMTDVQQLPCVYEIKLVSARPVIITFFLKNIYRWYSTPSFTIKYEDDITIRVSCPVNYSICIDRILLVRMDSINVPVTDPLNPDTDGDGLRDGAERIVDSYWWEAEDYASDGAQIVDNRDVSNGKYVLLAANTGLIRIPGENYVWGPYVIYVRARKQDLNETKLIHLLNVRISIKYENQTEITIYGSVLVEGPYRRGRWTPVYYSGNRSITTLWLERPAKVGIELWTAPGSPPIYVDEVVLVRMRLPAISRREFDVIPRCLNPMDPDTDGDQYRYRDGTVENSTGYLTDGFEWNLGLNPFDVDTDQDGFINLTLNYPYTDDVDPNPFSWDSDRDGIFDWMEDRFPPLGVWNKSFETNFLDADTDDDGILDGNEDWNYDGEVDGGETDPLNEDTDGDGVIDGYELGLWSPQAVGRDTNQDGLPDTKDTYAPGKWQQREAREMLYISDPLNPDTDGDGLPDGWIDFNQNGVKDLGEFEDRDCDGQWDKGDWNQGRGPGETSPTIADTDHDAADDQEEIMVRNTNPLRYDYPDLSISSEDIQFNPKKPLIKSGVEDVTVNVNVLISNKGYQDLPPSVEARIWFMIEISTKIDGVEVTWVSQKLYELVAGRNVSLGIPIQLPAGKHNLTVEIVTHAEAGVYSPSALPIPEENYDNNECNVTLTVKTEPTAYITAEPLSGYAPLNVTFTFWGEDPDGGKLEYDVDLGEGLTLMWGDEDPGTKETFVFTYKHNGSYIVTLWVTDEDGHVVVNQTDMIHVLYPDPDGDGLNAHIEEEKIGTRPDDADTDDDGLTDGEEYNIYGSDPLKDDSDGDGISDYKEIYLMNEWGLNASKRPDSDKDGKINIRDPDSDGDGLFDGEEYWKNTNPYLGDTDGDGLSDFEEVKTSPISNDTDGDGLNDGDEVRVYLTDPQNPDSDGDKLTDGNEVFRCQSNPNKVDTDGDNWDDWVEVRDGTNPSDSDTDHDGLGDNYELQYYNVDWDNDGLRNPLDPDSDNDGLPDGLELKKLGTDWSKQDLFIEVDYMDGYGPTQIAMNIVSDFFQREMHIRLHIYIDDRVTSSDLKAIGVTPDSLNYDERVSIERAFHDFRHTHVYVFYAKALDEDALGLAYRDYGAFLDIEAINWFAIINSWPVLISPIFLLFDVTRGEAEAQVLAHEVSHCINITIRDKKGNEVYCDDLGRPWCIMAKSSYHNAVFNLRICQEHRRLAYLKDKWSVDEPSIRAPSSPRSSETLDLRRYSGTPMSPEAPLYNPHGQGRPLHVHHEELNRKPGYLKASTLYECCPSQMMPVLHTLYVQKYKVPHFKMLNPI